MSHVEAQRRYRERNLEAQRAASRRWKTEHGYTASDQREPGLRWRDTPRGRMMQARSAAALKFGEAIALDGWAALWSGKCFDCGKDPAEGVDHIIPAARGGRNIVSNLQPACLPCNLRKYSN